MPEDQIFTLPSKGNRFFKIAIIIFVLIVILVGAEAAYYFLGKEKLSSPLQVTPTPNLGTIDNPPPPSDVGMFIPTPKPGASLNTDKLQRYLTHLEEFKRKQSILSEATIKTVYAGTVVKSAQEQFTIDNQIYHWLITLQDENGTGVEFRLTKTEVDNADIFLITNIGKVKTTIDQITAGDKLVITTTDDFLDPSPSAKIELQVIKSL